MADIRFISYTGKYPNLCSGVLTLEIDSETAVFGHDADFDAFWLTGGSCGCGKDFSEYVKKGEWRVDKDMLPKKYAKYADELGEVFNANVPWGCCGGCI